LNRPQADETATTDESLTRSLAIMEKLLEIGWIERVTSCGSAPVREGDYQVLTVPPGAPTTRTASAMMRFMRTPF
jgi:hypothetical protein